MKGNIGFFQEGPNNNSITRAMFCLGILWGMALTSVLAFKFNLPVGEIIALFGGITGPFFALKLIQKPMESKEDNQLKNTADDKT